MDASAYNTFRDIAVVIANLMLLKYFIFLLVSPLHDILEARRRIKVLKNRIAENKTKYAPLLSVIIPAWNEEKGIIKTIQSVLDNTYEHIEVIAVSDGSEDRTNELVEAFIKKNCDKKGYYKIDKVKTNRRLIFIKKENGGKGSQNHPVRLLLQ
jgi:biofilm PGA synthesis N-glycosyltransferase PgaC